MSHSKRHGGKYSNTYSENVPRSRCTDSVDHSYAGRSKRDENSSKVESDGTTCNTSKSTKQHPTQNSERAKEKQQFINEYRREYGGTKGFEQAEYSSKSSWKDSFEKGNGGHFSTGPRSSSYSVSGNGVRGYEGQRVSTHPSGKSSRPAKNPEPVESESHYNDSRPQGVPRNRGDPGVSFHSERSTNSRNPRTGKSELRHPNTRFKDFSDARLFNPYESDRAGESSLCSALSPHLPPEQNKRQNESTMVSTTQSTMSSSDKPSSVTNNSIDPNSSQPSCDYTRPESSVSSSIQQDIHLQSHQHGGIIHLPKSIQLFSGTVSPMIVSSAPCSNPQQIQPSSTPPSNHVSQHHPTTQPMLPAYAGYPRGFVPPPPPQGYARQAFAPPPAALASPVHNSAAFYPPRVPIPSYAPYHPMLPIVPPANFSPAIQTALQEIHPLEMKLAHLLSQPLLPSLEQWWKNIQETRSCILSVYQEVILKELEFCHVFANLELHMWKSSFHAVVEVFRTLCSEPDDVLKKRLGLAPDAPSQHGVPLTEQVEHMALTFIQESQEFITHCLQRLSDMYSVRVHEAMNTNYTLLSICLLPPVEVKKTSSRTRKLVYFSAQKFCVFCGDLARYRESITKRYEFGEARKWYLRAQVLEPRNGTPYNQLAVLAHCAKRYLDAIYYYMRSLAATNPSHTPIQVLGTLFEDVRRTSESLNRTRKNSLKRRRDAKLSAMERHQTRFGGDSRLEIWTHPKGGNKVTTLVEEEAEEKEDYSNMAFVDLHNRFTVSFMHCHAKLFTKIGMESFPEVCSSMLQELRGLLCHTPLPFNGESLCHLLLMNAFEIHRGEQQASKGALLAPPPSANGSGADGTGPQGKNNLHMRSQLQEQVCRMGLDMFALLCERTLQLIKNFREPPSLPLDGDLRALFQAIRLWSDWMIFHAEQWNPPPASQDPTTMCSSPLPDCWTMLAALCTRISQWMDTTDNKNCGVIRKPLFMLDKPNAQELQTQGDSPWQAFVLSEEAACEGFSPMQESIPQIVYYRKGADTNAIADYIRFDKLALFGDFLSGIEPPVLEYNIAQQEYRSLVPIEASERLPDAVCSMDSAANQLVLEQGSEQVQDMLKQLMEEEAAAGESSQDSISSQQLDTTQLSDSTTDSRIIALRRRRNDLLREQQFYQEQEAKRQFAIQSAINRHCLELHVFPVYLVADTNCYIDHLAGIQSLCRSQYFTIVIPLIVINELDYLSQISTACDEVPFSANVRIKSTKSSRGGNATSSLIPEHFTVDHLDVPHSYMLRKNAQAAIKWLEDQFDVGNHKLKAMASDGTTMQTIQFRTESFDRNGRKNDDIILDCCHSFVHDKAKDFILKDKDQSIRLHREVVLLTGDRNMRLKALAANIPVRPLKPFLRWAKIKV